MSSPRPPRAGAGRPGGRPRGGRRRWNGRRRSAGSRRPARRPRHRRTREVARPALERRLGLARPGSASRPRTPARSARPATCPSRATPPPRRPSRSPGPGACPTFRNRCSRSVPSGIRTRTSSSSGLAAVWRYAGQNSVAGTSRSPAAPPTTSTASSASSTGSVSPAGEAFITLPAERAPVLDLGRADRRRPPRPAPAGARGRSASGGCPCTWSARRAPRTSPRIAIPRSSSSRHRSMTRSGGAPSSPVIWTSRSVPPAIGRCGCSARSSYASRREYGRDHRRLDRHQAAPRSAASRIASMIFV